MTYIRLKAGECEATGKLGLFLNNVNRECLYASLSGELIAHDIIEHQNGAKNIGGVCDELEALGGVWFVRGQYGYLREGSYNPPQEGLASDVAQCYEDYLSRDCWNDRKYRFTHSHDYDEDFLYIIEKAEKLARYCDEPMTEEFKSMALHALRTGFRKANKRFKSGLSANYMFWEIARAVDSIVEDMYCEGQEFLLNYTRNGASAREVWEDDDY